MNRNYIKYDIMLNEFKSYNIQADFEEIFYTLDSNYKEDLDFLTEYYYENLKPSDTESSSSIITKLSSVKDIDGIDININLYLLTNFKVSLISNETINKIGINVIIKEKDALDGDITYLQHISLSNFDINNEEEFKNYIYNILFYAHVVVKYFEFHPLLKYIYHEDDIDNLVEIRKSHIRLFGKEKECCVCMEETITNTSCKHPICQKCYANLSKKICPMCRKSLDLDNTITQNTILTLTNFLS